MLKKIIVENPQLPVLQHISDRSDRSAVLRELLQRVECRLYEADPELARLLCR